jgi:hypothetical protein
VGRSVAVSLVILIVATACSPYYTNEPGPMVPPAIVGSEWTHAPDYDSDCALGLTEAGLTFVVGASLPWGLGGVAAEWLSWTITGSLTPVGASAAQCWNSLAANGGQFALYLKCYGEPYIKYWFDNIGQAQKWAAIPMCQCNIGCQSMTNGSMVAAWKAQARAEQRYDYCQLNWWQDFSCAWPHPNGWPFGGEGPTTDEPLPPDEPLPVDWDAPWWDTSIPIPPPPG